MTTKYVYDQYGQFNSKYIDELRETLDEDVNNLAVKFAELVIDKNFDRYQLEKYLKNELETKIIYQINIQNFNRKKK